MKSTLFFLQKFQDSSAKKSGSEIIICNLKGELLTNISRGNDVMETQLIEKDTLRTFLAPLQSIKQTIVMDTAIGSKVIISPALLNGIVTYFVVLGFTLERQTEKTLEYRINMVEMIASYVELQEEYRQTREFTEFISKKMNSINNRTSTIDSILEVGGDLENVDFIAFAKESGDYTFTVETSIGAYSNSLNGYKFSIGEGLLGYSIATKSPQFNENIENDARMLAFTKINMKVVSLFCFPIIKNDKVIGLLFGGSTAHEIKKESVFNQLAICASLVTTHLEINGMRNKTENQLLELTTYKEIIKVLTTVKDLHKILSILIDINMNFTGAVFTSIVFKKDIALDQTEVISKGLTEREINYYSLEIAQRVFSEKFNSETFNSLPLKENAYGVIVIEYPLIYNEEVYGLLSVGVRPAKGVEKYKSVISSLATAGAIAIHFLGKEERGKNKRNLVELVQKIMKEYEPEKYELAMRMKKSVMEFSEGVELVDRTIARQVSSLCVYNRELLENVLDNENLLLLIKRYYEVLNNQSDGDLTLELVAIVWTYYSNNGQVDAIQGLNIVNDDLKHQFISWISRNQVVEKEFTLTENQEIVQSKEMIAEDYLFKELNITPRETEVLNYVIQGCSNKEIAKLLYISEHTVKNHMTNILSKLDVSDRSQAIAKVYQLGYNPV